MQKWRLTMLDVFALIATLFIGFGLGGVAIAVFLYAVEKMQNGGRDDTR
jgi:Flp pilus assembly protein TadG